MFVIQDLWPGIRRQGGVSATDTNLPHVGPAARPACVHGADSAGIRGTKAWRRSLGQGVCSVAVGCATGALYAVPIDGLCQVSSRICQHAECAKMCMHSSLAIACIATVKFGH